MWEKRKGKGRSFRHQKKKIKEKNQAKKKEREMRPRKLWGRGRWVDTKESQSYLKQQKKREEEGQERGCRGETREKEKGK